LSLSQQISGLFAGHYTLYRLDCAGRDLSQYRLSTTIVFLSIAFARFSFSFYNQDVRISQTDQELNTRQGFGEI